MLEIQVPRDFSPTPGGRHRADGPYTGEHFREDVLVPALQTTNDLVRIVLDGAAGYPGSFLEEAFGGLVRKGYTPNDLRRRLDIRADEPAYRPYVDEIWALIDDAARHLRP